MGKYLKLFENHSQYQTFIGGGGETPFIKPNVSHCITENEVHYNPFSWTDEYLTFVAKESGTFQLSKSGVSYSLDNGETWTELAAKTASPTVTAGKKIMWKGTITPQDYSGVGTFSSTGNFDVQGNAMSLLYGDDFRGKVNLSGKNFAFNWLFRNNTKVVSAENLSLPATTLANDCYMGMFEGCTSLVNAPELPATTLADFCYTAMFSGCTSLTTAPALPATTLANQCYSYMFSSCTSLKTAPQLPATTLAYNCCGSMFYGCTSLETAPELPATELVAICYSYMFQNCTSLVTAPELPATTLAERCYAYMFQNCTNLAYIKAMFTTTPSDDYTKDWVSGVASSGTFVKNSAAQWEVSGVNGIPSGWSIETASA